MTGVIQKQKQQIKTLDNASIQLASKSMENNLLIGGLKETDDNCPDEQEKLDDIKFIPSAPTVSQGSYFCGYITTASNLAQVKQAYTHLYQTIPKSDHVMTAYKVTLSDGKELRGASSVESMEQEKLSAKY